MIQKYIKYLIGFCIGVSFSTGLFLGYSYITKEPIVKESNVEVYLNDNLQTFRTVDGVRLGIIEYEGVQYIPFGPLGGFLGYDVSQNSEKIFLKSKGIEFGSDLIENVENNVEKEANISKINTLNSANSIDKDTEIKENIDVSKKETLSSENSVNSINKDTEIKENIVVSEKETSSSENSVNKDIEIKENIDKDSIVENKNSNVFDKSEGLNQNNKENIEDISTKDKYSENVFVNISSKDLDGVLYSNDDIYMNDYTLFLVWADWCPDCEKVLETLSENKEYLKENNIEVVGLPIYSSNDKLDDILKKMQEYDLNFRNLQTTPEIESFFFNNLDNIPAVFVVDSKGRLRLEDKTMFIQLDNILKDIVSLADCSEC